MKPRKLPHFYLLKIFKNQDDMLKVKFLETNNKINMLVPYFLA